MWDGPRENGVAIYCGTSGLVVIDFDAHDAFDRLEAVAGGFPPTPTVVTHRGVQLWFQRPDLGPNVEVLTHDLRDDGIEAEVRGDRALVMAPPSLHPTGIRYRFSRSPVHHWPPAPYPGRLEHLLRTVDRTPPAAKPARPRPATTGTGCVDCARERIGTCADVLVAAGFDPHTHRCPLAGHEDRRPSFGIYRTKPWRWKCHGCGEGGDSLDLYAHLHGVPMAEVFRRFGSPCRCWWKG